MYTNKIWALCNGKDGKNPLRASGNMKDEMEIIICSSKFRKRILSLLRLPRHGRKIELHHKKPQMKLLYPSNYLIRIPITIQLKEGSN